MNRKIPGYEKYWYGDLELTSQLRERLEAASCGIVFQILVSWEETGLSKELKNWSEEKGYMMYKCSRRLRVCESVGVDGFDSEMYIISGEMLSIDIKSLVEKYAKKEKKIGVVSVKLGKEYVTQELLEEVLRESEGLKRIYSIYKRVSLIYGIFEIQRCMYSILRDGEYKSIS